MSCQLVFLEKSCSDEEHEVALSRHVKSIIICQGSNDIIRSFFLFLIVRCKQGSGIPGKLNTVCLIRAHAFLHLCDQKRCSAEFLAFVVASVLTSHVDAYLNIQY